MAWLFGLLVLPALGIAPKTPLHFIKETTSGGIDWRLRQPEPLEQQRYLLAVGASLVFPFLLAFLITRPGFSSSWITVLGRLVQIAVFVFVFLASLNWQPFINEFMPDLGDGAVLLAVAILLLVLISVRYRIKPYLCGTSYFTEAVCAAASVALALLGASAGFYRDSDIAGALPHLTFHAQYFFSEAYAVTAGLTPLVDFTSAYSTLFGYIFAPLLELRPMSIGMFTGVNALGTVIALVLVYAALRLIASKPVPALLLFVVVATLGLIPLPGDPGDGRVTTISTYFAVMPMRYLGPIACLVLALLVAMRPLSFRLAAIAGFVGGLTLINNLEFGLPAVVGLTLASVLSFRAPNPGRRLLLKALAVFAAGCAGAIFCFVAVTALRSGALPSIYQYTYFPRQFAIAGVSMLPFGKLLGLPAVAFVTFSAATTAGLVPALIGTRRNTSEGRVETAALIFSGVFGMGAFAYYAGRSHPAVFTAVFLAWGLALAVLSVTATRWLMSGEGIRRPGSPLALLVLGMFLLMGVGGISRAGYLLDQPKRILGPRTTAPDSRTQFLVRECVKPGSDTLVMLPYGQRIAQGAGLRDHFPFNHPDTILTLEQLDVVRRSADREKVSAVVSGPLPEETTRMLASAGFRLRATRDLGYAGQLGARSVFDVTDKLFFWERRETEAITCKR